MSEVAHTRQRVRMIGAELRLAHLVCIQEQPATRVVSQRAFWASQHSPLPAHYEYGLSPYGPPMGCAEVYSPLPMRQAD
jgi:hypothetical protein